MRLFSVQVDYKPVAAAQTAAFPELPDTMSQATKDILIQHRAVFEEPSGLPPDRGVEHLIDELPGSKPVHRSPYRLSPVETKEMERQVEDLLAKGFIVPSSSPYASPILFVAKPNGALRMCVYYRRLNTQTIKQRWPLPRIDQLLDSLHGATVFSSLDLQSGFHQIAINEKDQPKTAFITPNGQYQWKVMGFGLCNAPSTFKKTMHTIFRPLIGKGVQVYMDDLLCYGRTKEEHSRILGEVFALLDKHKLYVNASKCCFEKSELKYLGHIVSKDGIKVDPAKTAAVQSWPAPTSVRDVRSFLGLGNYFRRFIQGYTKLAAPMQALVRDDLRWGPTTWTAQCQASFDGIKHALSNAPVLAVYDNQRPHDKLNLELWTDASELGTGAVLMQDLRPLAYHSVSFKGAERNWTTTEKELWAIRLALEHFRCYLEGGHFKVITDHNPLIHLQSQPSLSRKQARWLEYMQRFDVEYVYKPGRINVSDTLSRIPQHTTALCAYRMTAICKRAVICRATTRGQLLHRNTPALVDTSNGHQRHRKRVRFTSPPVSDSLSPPDVGQDDDMGAHGHMQGNQPALPTALPLPPIPGGGEADVEKVNQILRAGQESDPWFSKANNTTDLVLSQQDALWRNEKGRVVVPNVPGLRKQLISFLHDPPHAGHPGAKRTKELVQRAYWWRGMGQDVDRYVATCPSCQRNKSSNQKPAGLLQPLPIPSGPWMSVSMDFITHLPDTVAVDTHGRPFNSLAVFVDRYSKMALLRPCSEKITAEQFATLFDHTVATVHGQPTSVISDRDSKFTGEFWRSLMAAMETKLGLSTAYHPQTDGQTERMNRVINDMLRHYVGNNTLSQWDQLIPAAEFAINNAFNESLGSTPFRVNKGYDPRAPKALHVLPKMFPEAKQWAEMRAQGLGDAQRFLEAAQQRQKAYYDSKHSPITYKVGQSVMLITTNLNMNRAGQAKTPRRFLPKYMGPFKITHAISDVAYRLQLPNNLSRMHNVFHVSKLKLYKHDDDRGPITAECPEEFWVGDEIEFVVDKVLEHKDTGYGRGGSRYEYLVKYRDFKEPSWQPAKYVNDCVQYYDYWASLGKPAPKPQGRQPKSGKKWTPEQQYSEDSD